MHRKFINELKKISDEIMEITLRKELEPIFSLKPSLKVGVKLLEIIIKLEEALDSKDFDSVIAIFGELQNINLELLEQPRPLNINEMS